MPRPVSNPVNPWSPATVEWLDGLPPAELTVFEENAKSILSKNASPDISFRWSVNPYRGCYHGCAYCYARPSHQYLGFGAGTDFDRKIVVKVNAPRLLEEAFARRSWQRERVCFSGNTDCYQPLEAHYRLTRQCLEVCADSATPVTIITKSAVIRRDVDVLQALSRASSVRVFVSIPFAKDADAARMEPYASSTTKRFETLRKLSEHGIETGIGIAPVIPGLNDADIPELLKRARSVGASTAFFSLLRLPAEVLPVFRERLHEAYPARARKVENAIRDVRGGAMNDPRFASRMHGRGARWEAIESLFETHARRLGFLEQNGNSSGEGTASHRSDETRRKGRQLPLFD